jgi:hypothetical protein
MKCNHNNRMIIYLNRNKNMIRNNVPDKKKKNMNNNKNNNKNNKI